MRIKVKQALAAEQPLQGVTVSGWVRTRRDAKDFSFVELNDGSCFKNLQVVVDAGALGGEHLKDALTGSSVSVDGELVPSPAKGQKWELKASAFRLLGRADETFPLQKKGHTVEFLRTIPHLRARTNRLGSMMRVRSRMAMAVHEFFQQRGFAYVHTPIVTASDCEGAGELFRVTTLDPVAPPKTLRGQGRLGRGFLRQTGVSDGLRPARGRDPRVRLGRCLYVRADVPGREFAHEPSRQ